MEIMLKALMFLAFMGSVKCFNDCPTAGHELDVNEWLDMQNTPNIQCITYGLIGRISGDTLERLAARVPGIYNFQLYYNRLTGTIPSQIGLFEDLTNLMFFDNVMTGTVPKEIGLLTKLTNLDLGWNTFTGTLPEELFSLTKLNSLFVDENELTGTLSSRLGNLNLLRDLWIRQNHFHGTFPCEIGKLTQLNFLTIKPNDFIGTMPYFTLVPPANNYADTFPGDHLGGFEFVACPDVHEPQVDINDFLFSIAEDTAIIRCSGHGKLTGQISPPAIKHLRSVAPSLSLLDVSYNKITGSIPSEIGLLTNLRSLNLNDNYINGTISSMIGLKKLQHLSIYDNSISGTLPEDLFSLTNLQGLQVQQNRLSGTLSSRLGGLKNLANLFIGDNHFVGTFPTEIEKLTVLYQLYVKQNDFIGTMPNFITSIEFGSDTFPGDVFTNVLDGDDIAELSLQNGLGLSKVNEEKIVESKKSPENLINFRLSRLKGDKLPADDDKDKVVPGKSKDIFPFAIIAAALALLAVMGMLLAAVHTRRADKRALGKEWNADA